MNTPQHPAFSRNLFPWVGSKRRLAKEIIARLPAHECYCEPFAGSAAVFFRKPPSGVEILNDVCGDIVNFFRVIQRHLPEFLRMFEYSIGARAEFDRLRATPRGGDRPPHRPNVPHRPNAPRTAAKNR